MSTLQLYDQNSESLCYRVLCWLRYSSFSRFYRTRTCDGQTDRRTDARPWHIPR